MIRYGLKLGPRIAWDAPGGARKVLDGKQDTGYRIYWSPVDRVYTLISGNRTWSKNVGNTLDEAWRRSKDVLIDRLG